MGSYLVGWSDGGFDSKLGGTASFIIMAYSNNTWMRLAAGGCFDKAARDSFQMEAIGAELLMTNLRMYTNCFDF